ncbi:hypothetical protein [Sulfuricurvum sp.]|uniref:hypothetical protein n=1 Tax=Sulfuricurvum sp. TaxID=2025608 RepID=UPI002624D108|nr:hypothetical protein [Sulfuricurvum sp.]MDD2780955.1 hypothetical protein [Sulfuricurvum sp.]
MNLKVVSDIVTILNEFLSKDFYALDFTQEVYLQLLQRLEIANETHFDDKKGAIKKALINYFSKTNQSIDIELTFARCIVQKSFLEPNESEVFDRKLFQNTLRIIDISERKSEYSPLPYLISIPENIRYELFQSFQNTEMARTITRQQIENIFNLDPRDIIFFIRGKISIRFYTLPKQLPKGMDKRFAGESHEVMQQMYENYFPDGAWSQIEEILREVINEKLNFSTIDNQTFAKMCVPIFRSMLEILLLDIIDNNQRDKIEGFTGYVLRQHFQNIFLYMAKNLLEYVENRDKNAELFIKYYADEIILDPNGNKIQKYAITDTKNQKWNFSSIVSIMMQYKQMKLRISSQKETIHTAQGKVSESHADIESEKDHHKLLDEQIDVITGLIAENDGKILQYKSKAGTPNSLSNSTEIQRLNNMQDDLFTQKKNGKYQLELSNGRLANKKIELVRCNKKLFYEQNTLKTLIEQTLPIVESYELVSEAIALVLAKR